MHCETRQVEGGYPLKLWTRGVPVDESAFAQLENVARLPIIFKHIAVMPDVHFGKGATIGSVLATQNAIIPTAVGLDIGCGMQAVRTNLKVEDLRPHLTQIRQLVERAILRGFTEYGGAGFKARDGLPRFVEWEWSEGGLGARYECITREDRELFNHYNARQLGTLGSGNHFIELSADEDGLIWWMLHSGSRGPGARIATVYMARAAAAAREKGIDLPHPDLAYLEESTPLFDDYIRAMLWAQDFARINRNLMMNSALAVLEGFAPFETSLRIDCHHNFASEETHFGQKVWVTRKGATRAGKGEWGIIPGSMGTGSYIVQGLGNADSFTSCSHGAGRVMSRTLARQSITLEDHIAATQGIDCCKEKRVLDESPAAYKDLTAVMQAQSELITPVHHLRPLLNIKG